MQDGQGATRRISHGDLRSVAVRCAQLRVVRGRDTGTVLDFGARRSAVLGTDAESDLVLTDDSVSFRHAELRAEEQGYVLRDLGSTNGTRVGGVRVGQVVLDATPATISVGETDLAFVMRDDEVRHPLASGARFERIVGHSEAMQQMFAILERATTADSTILLEGESGTGKELVAEAIHAASARAENPFQVLDCGSIPPSLIESELFGVRAGAFTGATRDRAGAIEEAASGTLFLDEVGELPLEMQPRLLRAIEQRQVKPVGATRFLDVDFRVVAATNRNLRKLVDEGKFRADLYYRLAVVPIEVPALRHRREDIPLLARHFLSRLSVDAVDAAKQEILTPSLLSAFAAYDWPGNVRELRNAVERLVVLGDMARLPVGGHPVRPLDGGADEYASARREAVARFERDYCRALLDRARGVVAKAAVHAGISRQMFHRLLRKHGIEVQP
jgi:DNA-binding NtrC family response regulator